MSAHTETAPPPAAVAGPAHLGLLVEFADPDALCHAAEKVRDAGMIGWSVVVSRVLTLPDGTTREEKRKVTYKPKARRIEVHPCRIPKGEKGYTGERCPEPKDAEMIGARSVIIAGFATKMPNDKATTNPTMTKQWERWSKEMEVAGTELAAEGAKADKADQVKMLTILNRLDASCSNCHNDFRD